MEQREDRRRWFSRERLRHVAFFMAGGVIVGVVVLAVFLLKHASWITPSHRSGGWAFKNCVTDDYGNYYVVDVDTNCAWLILSGTRNRQGMWLASAKYGSGQSAIVTNFTLKRSHELTVIPDAVFIIRSGSWTAYHTTVDKMIVLNGWGPQEAIGNAPNLEHMVSESLPATPIGK